MSCAIATDHGRRSATAFAAANIAPRAASAASRSGIVWALHWPITLRELVPCGNWCQPSRRRSGDTRKPRMKIEPEL